MAAIIELEHVNVARGRCVVLHDVSLRVEAGEHVAILGPNGCGKSTLLKTLTCELYPLVRPETRVSLMGRARWDLTELRRRMGVVSAELPGKPMLATAGFDAVLTGFFSSSTLWPNLQVTAEMRDRASEILRLVGMEALSGKPVGEMSAGQQRRVMIGRAIAGNRGESAGGSDDPQMLLLDEPSNALDLRAQRELREMLGELARGGTAVLLITHHLADILPEMRRVVMMQEGRIVADGLKDDLLTEPHLEKLFGVKVRLRAHDDVWSAS